MEIYFTQTMVVMHEISKCCSHTQVIRNASDESLLDPCAEYSIFYESTFMFEQQVIPGYTS